jgi:hypothetical protein
MDRVRIILEYVRDNPECSSLELDGYLVKDIIETKGYLDGLESFELDEKGPKFYRLRVTLKGDEYLSSLTLDKQTPSLNLFPKAIGQVCIGVIIILVGAAFIYLIKIYGGINL